MCGNGNVSEARNEHDQTTRKLSLPTKAFRPVKTLITNDQTLHTETKHWWEWK